VPDGLLERDDRHSYQTAERPTISEEVSVLKIIIATVLLAHGRAGGRPMESRAHLTGWLGVAAAALFVGATAAGSLLDPDYSQLREHVSELTASGAPTWVALAPLYVAYNLLVIAFAVALYRASDRGSPWRIGLGLMVVNGLAGVGMTTWFRQDPGGVPTTFAGSGHLVLAGISSLTIVLGSIVFGLAFRRTPAWRPLARFSFAIAAGFVVLGPLAVIATAAGSDLRGLAERGPIGLFIAWLIVVGWFALVSVRQPVAQGASAPVVR
jgi:hypothetical protein